MPNSRKVQSQGLVMVLGLALLTFGAACSNSVSSMTNTNRSQTNSDTDFIQTNTATPGVILAPVATTANTNIGTPHLTIPQVLGDPTRYNNATICVTGHYQQTLQTSVLGATIAQGQEVQPPYIWIYKPDTTYPLACVDASEAGHKNCYGMMTVCGPFRYKPAGGLGQGGSYMYAIDGEATGR